MRKTELSSRGFPDAIRLPTRSEMWLPHASLSACVRAVISRDTRGVSLSPQQRYNYFPATPLCAFLWYFEGEAEILEVMQGAEDIAPDCPGALLPAHSFCGPMTQPGISRNPGPMHAFMVLFLPDALAALTGIDVGQFLNRKVALESIFDPVRQADWLAMLEAVRTAADDDSRVQLLADFLTSRWQALRPDPPSLVRDYRDWSQGLVLRAANSGLGRSLRQMERRIKQWTGQPLRELRGQSRAEQVFFDAVVASEDGAVNWSRLADQNGYTDQSHLSRQTRRITGFPPEELRRRVITDETFWMYRLWGGGA